jgi:hypothetical protein
MEIASATDDGSQNGSGNHSGSYSGSHSNTESQLKNQSYAAIAAWMAMAAFVPSNNATAWMVWAAVLAIIYHETSQEGGPRRRPMMCTPAILLSIHWSTHTALTRLAPQHKSGIAPKALPFVALTVACGSLMLVLPTDKEGAVLHSTLAYIGVGSFAMHACITVAPSL